jgi:hypothetical protein
MEASTMELARRGRVRQWLSADGPASRGTQLFLFVSALLCGAALSALLFVGVWRHTAGEAARTRDAQVGEHRALVATRHELAALRTRFRNDVTLLAKARRANADAVAALAQTRHALTRAQHTLVATRSADTAARSALTARAQALAAAAASLVRQTTTLRSELGALESYASAPGATGVDPGYIASQAHYLLAAASSAVSSAEDLSGRAQALGAG